MPLWYDSQSSQRPPTVVLMILFSVRPISHWCKYSQRAFMANDWCLRLPLCVHTGASESTRGNHLRECSCTLALSTKCSCIHTSSWTRGRLFIDNRY